MTKEPVRATDPQKLTRAYRRLVLWFGAQLLLFAGSFGLQAFSPESVIGFILATAVSGGFLLTALALGYYGFRTSAALGSTVAWLWGIAMLVPYVNVVSLLALNSKASKACTAQGIAVGLLGPRLATKSERGGAG